MVDLDPAGPILARLFALDSSAVVEAIDAGGLSVDWTVTEKENYSNNTRKRVYHPRVSDALDALSPEQRIRALGLIARRLEQRGQSVVDDLAAIGWTLHDDVLQPARGTSPTRGFSRPASEGSPEAASTVDPPGPPPRRAFVITALGVEFNAVGAHLVNIHETTHRAGSVYEVGRFDGDTGPWEVAIVQVGKGNPAAALEGERGISQFNPDVVLMIGIAGGLKDVQIGDVVASDKVYYYEPAKDTNEGLKLRAEAGDSSHALVHRARAVARKDAWPTRIRGNAPAKRPRAVVAPIAAGEKVVSGTNSGTYLLVRRSLDDAVAVEMEGYGVLRAAHANEARAIIIRGISDTIDQKTEADAGGSHDLASRHAAAFAFQLLGEMPSDGETSQRDGDDIVASIRRASSGDGGDRKTAAQGLLADAATMMHRLLSDPGTDLERLLADAEQWQRKVEATLASLPWVTEADKHDFSVITPWRARGLGGVNPAHAQIREDVIERIQRLRLIARKSEDPASEPLSRLTTDRTADSVQANFLTTGEPVAGGATQSDHLVGTTSVTLPRISTVRARSPESENATYNSDTSTSFFHGRMCDAFPGCEGLCVETHAPGAADRLRVLLQKPLGEGGNSAIWEVGFGTMAVQSFRSAPDSLAYLNYHRYRLGKVIGYRSLHYWRDFVLLCWTADQPTGLYPIRSAENIADSVQRNGKCTEEYGVWRNDLVTRREYDDGAVFRDGKVRRRVGARLEVRQLAAGATFIVGQLSPLNDLRSDRQREQLLKGHVAGKTSLDDIVHWVETLPRHRREDS